MMGDVSWKMILRKCDWGVSKTEACGAVGLKQLLAASGGEVAAIWALWFLSRVTSGLDSHVRFEPSVMDTDCAERTG